MNALLEIPAIRQRAARLSVKDYHSLPELPVELLRGTIVQKMSKSPLHRYIADELRNALAGRIPSDCILFSESPLTLSDSEPEPDLMVTRGKKADFRRSHPSTAELIIEVAVSSLEIDRVKALIYAEAGVKEYWIVCPEEKRVEVYRQPGPTGYGEQTVLTPPAILESSALPGVKVNLAAVLG